jgi:hypothetical protein
LAREAPIFSISRLVARFELRTIIRRISSSNGRAEPTAW